MCKNFMRLNAVFFMVLQSAGSVPLVRVIHANLITFFIAEEGKTAYHTLITHRMQ